jgi:hypothetical protein
LARRSGEFQGTKRYTTSPKAKHFKIMNINVNEKLLEHDFSWNVGAFGSFKRYNIHEK